MSETSHHPVSSIWPSQSLSQGMLMNGSCGNGGDWVGPPPGRLLNVRTARYGTGAGAEQVDRHAGDDVVDAEDDRGQRVDRATDDAEEDRAEDSDPGTVVVGEERATPRPEDHHALETDVDDARALAPEAAEAGQPDRHGQRDRGREGAGRVDVLGAGDHPDGGEHDDRAADDGEPEPPGAMDGSTRRWRRLEARRDDQSLVAHAAAPSVSGDGVRAAASCEATRRCSIRTPARRTSS